MFKKLLPILLLAVMAVAIFGGCESYKYGPVDGGDANAIVTNNGGLAVKQGDYLYFINGYADYDAEDPETNYFGNVVKGAVMRGTLNADNTLTDVVTVVPKKVMSSSTSTGIYVFGEWIYYVTPSTDVDNEGNVLTDYIDFFRTKIDGTKTQKITTIEGNDTKFKFTDTALVYYLDNKLVSIDLSGKKFEETQIDEEVNAVILTKDTVYNPASPDSLGEYIFYTKASEDEMDSNNVVYVVKADGSGKKVLIDKATYTANAADLNNIYTITLLDTSITDGKLALYYTKKTVAEVAVADKGVFGYEFADSSFTLASASEKCFSLTTATKIYPVSFTEGIFITNEAPYILTKAMDAEDTVPERVQYDFASAVTIVGISNTNGKDYLYYLNSSNLYRFPLDKSENAALIISDTIKTDWGGPAIIENLFFYLDGNEDGYKYTYMANLATFSLADSEALVNAMIGTMNDEDTEAKRIADEEASKAAAEEA